MLSAILKSQPIFVFYQELLLLSEQLSNFYLKFLQLSFQSGKKKKKLNYLVIERCIYEFTTKFKLFHHMKYFNSPLGNTLQIVLFSSSKVVKNGSRKSYK